VAGDTGVLMGQRLQSALTDPKSPNVVAPGKRPRITLTPMLVMKGGEPFMVLSTPGGDIDQRQNYGPAIEVVSRSARNSSAGVVKQFRIKLRGFVQIVDLQDYSK